MLCVSVCSVAGPVLCVGSLGAVSVRDARYVLRIRASILRYFTDSYVNFTKIYGFSCSFTFLNGFLRLLYGNLRIRTLFFRLFVGASCGVRKDSHPFATYGTPHSGRRRKAICRGGGPWAQGLVRVGVVPTTPWSIERVRREVSHLLVVLCRPGNFVLFSL